MTYLLVNQIMLSFVGVASFVTAFMYFRQDSKNYSKSDKAFFIGYMVITGILFIYSAYALGF